MDVFRSGELDVLVSTTVIEVGVDVPNATVMVILDADRFGIAQLHQLRGRVGRGADASTCFLVGAGSTPDGERRLEAMVRTHRRVRAGRDRPRPARRGHAHGRAPEGPQRSQAGVAAPRPEWVAKAREVAFELIDADPELDRHPLLAGEVFVFHGDDEADFLLKS